MVSRVSAAATASSTLRFPGVVAPNAYRQVVVTPLVSGRVTSRARHRPRTDGTEAHITSEANPGRQHDRRISYIDPQLDAATRSSKARIELHNPSGELRFGMYTNVVTATPAAASTPMVPRSAVQSVGSRNVVYLADANAPGRFVERDVHLRLNLRRRCRGPRRYPPW